MAEETNAKKKKTTDATKSSLFKNVTFFMRPCKERQDLRPAIESEGGKITSKATGGCYKLAEKGSTVSREGYITTDFVQDCIKEGRLLDTDPYKVKPGTTVRGDADMSLDTQDSNESLEHASVIIKTTAREHKGRNKFTKEEDLAMITYLIEEHRDHEAGGKRVWKDMEKLEITNHSAESMSARYRKVIMLNLDNYKYDISKSWMSRLAGYVQTDKEPEFSFEALFPKRRKKSLEMVNTDQKDKSDKAGKILNRGKSSDVTISSRNKETQGKDNEENVVENADKVEDEEGAALSKEQSTEKTNGKGGVSASEDVVMLEDSKVCTTAGKDEFTFTSDSDNSQILNNSRNRKRGRVDNTMESPRDSNKRRALLQNSVKSVDKATPPPGTGKAVHIDCRRSPRKTDRNMNHNDTVEESLIEDVVSSDLSGDSFDDMLCKYVNNQDKNKTDTLTSARDVTSNVTTRSKKVIKDTVESPCKKTATHALDSSKAENTRDSNSQTNNNEHRTRSRTRKGRDAINLTLSDSGGEEDSRSKRSDGNISPIKNVVQPQELELSYNSDSEEEPELTTTCKAIAKEFGLETGFVRELLYGFSGDVDTMLKWIEQGPERSGVQPWTESDDEELTKGQQKAMVSKYGKENVTARLFFLEGL